MTLEQIIKEVGLTKEQLEVVVDTYNHKNRNDILIAREVSDIGLANEDMNKGAIIAYQDIYNRISELENDEPREDSTN